MPFEDVRNNLHAILVEPGLHEDQGHMRGEAEALASGMLDLGVPCTIVAWRPPRAPLPESTDVQFVSPRFEAAINRLPRKIGVRLLEFQTYRKAFSLARHIEHPLIIGLTSSGPFGPALATYTVEEPSATIVITRHLGSALWKARSPWKFALQALARSGAGFGAYSEMVTQDLRTLLPQHTQRIRHLPEVIAAAPSGRQPNNHRPDRILLVSGMDNAGRRAPVRHLTDLESIPFEKIILHDPLAQFIGCDELQRKHSSVVFERVSRYFTNDFTGFMSTASAILVAYDSSFTNPSSILRHALCAGVPTLSSRFPDAEFLESEFGRIGELWTFGDAHSLASAMDRFGRWERKDFADLELTSLAIRSWANPAASAKALLEFARQLSQFRFGLM